MADVKRKISSPNVRRTTVFVAVFLAAAIVASLLFAKSCERRWRLGFVPGGLKVSKIIYAAETSAGIGPGGNESGVIVYELPEDVAETIRKNGIGFFTDSLADDRTRGGEKWEETPLLSDATWREAGEGKTTSEPQLENYLNRYGVGVAVETDVAREINRIIAQPGAYFARGRTGIVIVAPASGKVFYVYSG